MSEFPLLGPPRIILTLVLADGSRIELPPPPPAKYGQTVWEIPPTGSTIVAIEASVD